jgi:cytochrome P450
MRATRPGVTAWLGRRMLARVRRRNVDLTKMPFVPNILMMPLQRDRLDPVPGLATVREQAPMTRLARMFGISIWLVTGHEATRTLLSNTSDFSNDIRPYIGGSQESAEQYIGGLGFTDPPEHTRLRRILTPEFTMRRLERLKPRIADIIDRQLDEFEAVGQGADLVEHFAGPIPFLVICDLLGLPDEDREQFQQYGQARFDVTQGGIGSLGAVSESRQFLLDAVKRQRDAPGDGLIGKLIQEHGGEIDDFDLGGLADGVFTGGFETSASMLALGAMVLTQHPEEFAWLRTDDAAVDPMVEELLRYLSVVQIAFPRFARDDLELYGNQVEAGDVVIFSLSGANRDATSAGNSGHSDEQAGEDNSLERFDPHRLSAPHYAFGHGFHRCIGAELARMELRAAYPALVRRFPKLRLAVDPAELNFRKLSIVYGVESLPVRWD